MHRAIDGTHRASALDGSRLSGRYSAAGQPIPYLSDSPEGVAAATVAHGGARGDLTVLAFSVSVQAQGIVDLRDPAALRAAGVDLQDAVAPRPTSAQASASRNIEGRKEVGGAIRARSTFVAAPPAGHRHR